MGLIFAFYFAVQMLSEEYDQLSPNTLESRGLTNNVEYKRYSDLSCSPETSNKITGKGWDFLSPSQFSSIWLCLLSDSLI